MKGIELSPFEQEVIDREKLLLPGKVEKLFGWLEANRPGFKDKVDKKRLRMADPDDCLIGQINGPFGWPEFVKAMSYDELVELGLLLPLCDRTSDDVDVVFYYELTRCVKQRL